MAAAVAHSLSPDHPIAIWILEHADRAVVSLAEAEREHILRAMVLCRGSIDLAAERLGITRRTLFRRLAEYRRGK